MAIIHHILEDNIAVMITCKGDIDTEDTDLFAQALLEAMRQTSGRSLIDLRRVSPTLRTSDLLRLMFCAASHGALRRQKVALLCEADTPSQQSARNAAVLVQFRNCTAKVFTREEEACRWVGDQIARKGG